MNELGVENFKIELLDEITCETREDLHALEGHYVLQRSTLNHNLAGRSLKEWRSTKRPCSCGKDYTMTNAAIHKHSKFHNDKMLINSI